MNTPTLESVQNDFQQWRQHKPYLRSSTPADLRDKALSLRGQYSVPAICTIEHANADIAFAWFHASDIDRQCFCCHHEGKHHQK